MRWAGAGWLGAGRRPPDQAGTIWAGTLLCGRAWARLTGEGTRPGGQKLQSARSREGDSSRGESKPARNPEIPPQNTISLSAGIVNVLGTGTVSRHPQQCSVSVGTSEVKIRARGRVGLKNCGSKKLEEGRRAPKSLVEEAMQKQSAGAFLPSGPCVLSGQPLWRETRGERARRDTRRA